MKTILNCIIIDDDPDALEILQDYISKFPGLKLFKVYTDPALALTELSLKQDIDLLFLDIDMPEISGIKLAENLKEQVGNIIFTTAHAEYAIKSYNLNLKYYLLKPFDLARFTAVVADLISSTYVKTDTLSTVDDAFYLRTGERGKLTKVLKTAILYIQAAGNYVQLLLEDSQYTIYMTLTEMEQVLFTDGRFYRVHKSYIVNEGHVKRVLGNTIDLGKYQVTMSSQYKRNFMEYLEQRTLISKRL